jgi:excisionase family DNA binding protein
MTELLTALETAQLLRCSLRTLDRERSDGRGCPFVRIGGRIRYRRADVEAFIAAHVRGPVTGVVPDVDTLRRRGRLRKRLAERRAAP